MKKIKKQPLSKATPLTLDDERLRGARGGEDTLGKVVMDANILPT